MRFGLGAPANFPTDRDDKRAALLDAVEAVRPVLEATAAETREGRTLVPAAVDALRDSGLFALKLPAELGGAEADPVVQMDIIEAVAYIDPGAAWSMFITAAVTGANGANLPDEALDVLFENGRIPAMSGTLKPDGHARRVDGGYRVTGRWGWGSGIGYADRVMILSFSDEPPGVMSAAVPISDFELHDNWHVLGLEGSGSCDYSLDDVFVPDLFVTDALSGGQRRGGALYRMGMPGYVVNEHMAMALGVARRAIDALRDLATEKKRGYGAGTTIADRPAVQRLISESDLRLRAARLLCVEVLDGLFASCENGPPPAALVAEGRAAATFVTDEALAVTSQAFRQAGGTAVYLDSIFQRSLRDLYVIQSHFVVSETSYEQHGQVLLGSDENVGMGQ